MTTGVTLLHNPRCSKSRAARALLDEQGVAVTEVRYLDDAPDRAELERILGQLGLTDPRAMMRTGEAVYAELGLGDADAGALLDAMAAHPILIERPIAIRGDRAVIGRPPERVTDLLD
ncbi:arsenate reductase (glutaredoxin) [soil metagenome]